MIVGGFELMIRDFVTVATTIGVLETLIDFFFLISFFRDLILACCVFWVIARKMMIVTAVPFFENPNFKIT